MIEDLSPLSDRELEVLKLVATGATNQQIARELVISPNTVKVHLRNIFEKLGVQSRTEATMEAVRRGWVGIHSAGPADVPGNMEGTPGPIEALPASEPEILAQPHRPIATWQRVYMVLAACLVAAALLLPGWWQTRSAARPSNAFTDIGRAPVAPAVRTDIRRWTARAPLPQARSRLALVAAGNRLYAIGGESADGITGQVTVYDAASNGWLPAADKPTPVSNVAGGLINGRIYVPGGLVGAASGTAANTAGPGPSPVPRPSIDQTQVTAQVEVYDPQSDSWSTVAPLPAPRTAYGLAVAGNKLYLFGGWDGSHYRAETFIYDAATDAWSIGTPMAAPRVFLGAATLPDGIYVAGGYDGQHELNTVAVYHPNDEGSNVGPWASGPPLNRPRAGLGLLSLSNRLYAIGGGMTTALGFNEQFDTVTNAWSRFESPIAEQWKDLGLAGMGEKLYVVGGWGGSYLNVNEEYQAIYRVLLPVGKSPP
jgi:DNA-binding CsgD family transcriptional regulator/N-acetylneuraminic acid mutarotase